MKYEHTAIGEVTERAKADMDLIRKATERENLQAVITLVRYHAEAFMDLLEALEEVRREGRGI